MLRQHSNSSLLHHLRHKLVRIEKRTCDSGEESAFTGTARIVTYIRDDQCFITGKPGVGYFCESFDINHGFHGFVLCGFTTTAGIF
jgi:hypothetical protein